MSGRGDVSQGSEPNLGLSASEAKVSEVGGLGATAGTQPLIAEASERLEKLRTVLIRADAGERHPDVERYRELFSLAVGLLDALREADEQRAHPSWCVNVHCPWPTCGCQSPPEVMAEERAESAEVRLREAEQRIAELTGGEPGNSTFVPHTSTNVEQGGEPSSPSAEEVARLAEAERLLREATAWRTSDALHETRVFFGGPDMRLHMGCRLSGGGRLTCRPDCPASAAAEEVTDPCPRCAGHAGNNTFDRSVCPEPCGSMHTRCLACGAALDGCPFEDMATRLKDAVGEEAGFENSVSGSPAAPAFEALAVRVRELTEALNVIGSFAASHSGRDGHDVCLAALYRIAEECENLAVVPVPALAGPDAVESGGD